MHSRIRISRITRNLRSNQPKSWEMVQNHLLCEYESFISDCHVDETHFQLRIVLNHRFGKRCVWCAAALLVSGLVFVKIICSCIFWLILDFVPMFSRIDRYPFDWKNPVGFVLATILQVISMFYVNIIISAGLSTGVGVYLWALSMATDIKNNLKSINEAAKRKRKRRKLSKLLNVTIGYHSTSKRFVDENCQRSFSNGLIFEKNINLNFLHSFQACTSYVRCSASSIHGFVYMEYQVYFICFYIFCDSVIEFL